MRKFKLYLVTGGSRKRDCVTVNGFADAERKAKQMLKEAFVDCPNKEATFVECVEDAFELNLDHLTMTYDCFGDMYWTWLKLSEYGNPLYNDLLTEEQEEWLQSLREEKEMHIEDLSKEDLIELYSEVTFGSIYLSDYKNFAYIDENEVFDVCEHYDMHIEQDGVADTPEEFANWVMDNYFNY